MFLPPSPAASWRRPRRASSRCLRPAPSAPGRTEKCASQTCLLTKSISREPYSAREKLARGASHLPFFKQQLVKRIYALTRAGGARLSRREKCPAAGSIRPDCEALVKNRSEE